MGGDGRRSEEMGEGRRDAWRWLEEMGGGGVEIGGDAVVIGGGWRRLEEIWRGRQGALAAPRLAAPAIRIRSDPASKPNESQHTL